MMAASRTRRKPVLQEPVLQLRTPSAAEARTSARLERLAQGFMAAGQRNNADALFTPWLYPARSEARRMFGSAE